MGQQARGLDLRGQVGQLKRNRLEFADGLAELLAPFGIVQRRLVGALRHAQAEGRNRDAAAIQRAHSIDEAVALFAQQVLRRNLAVFEDQFRGVAGAQAELVFFLAGAESFGALFHHECRQSVGVRGLVGHGDHHRHVGVVSVGDEGLGAVEHPLVASAYRRAARAARIRTRARLRQPPCAEELAAGQLGNVFAFLLFIAGHEDVIAAK